MTTTVTTSTFDSEVLASEQPVIVDFWAEWCGPCRAVAPVLDRIAEERTELKVVKVNIDEEPDLARRYGVMSIPTIILFEAGEPAAAAVGAQPKQMLERSLGLVAAYPPPFPPRGGGAPPPRVPYDRGVRHQLASIHELARIELLAGLPGETLGQLAGRMIRRTLAPGDTILEGADTHGCFHVVVSGMLGGGGRTLRPGDTLGGFEPLDATVRAITPAIVASCDDATFEELVRPVLGTGPG